MKGLTEYNKKRNFNATKEPVGKKNKERALRFVIQYHKARTNHYDFRLEHNGVLLSWAIPKGLSAHPKEKRLAVMVEDHPVDYMNFEGIIPKGNYGAGTVEIFDKGNYLPMESIESGLKKGQLKFVLNGEKIKGAYSLIKIKDADWLAVKISDEYAWSSIVEKNNVKLPFDKCPAMLATLTDKLPAGKGWVSEIKYDGYRILAYKEKGKVRLLSRNYTDYTERFKSISQEVEKIDGDNFVLDGEVVCLDADGKSDFGLLQSNIRRRNQDFYYVVFDLVAIDGLDIRNIPLKDRKAKLERLTFNAGKRVIYSVHLPDLKECLSFSKEKGLEGIVVKKLNSVYGGGRSTNWLKIKNGYRQEFIITGYTLSEKSRYFGALTLGYYKNKQLVHVGKVGTGFSEEEKERLLKSFKKLLVKDSPFSSVVKDDVKWLKPVLVAEIKFIQLTKDGRLRQPTFLGLREDKQAKDVVLEAECE